MTTVLIIEDDDEIREMLSLLLMGAGYVVRTAAHGREGIRVARNEPIDIVITDILMPVQEGIETIAELGRQFPQVKIIAMSGGGIVQPEDYLATAQMFGAAMAISKPFDADEILQAVCYLASPTARASS